MLWNGFGSHFSDSLFGLVTLHISDNVLARGSLYVLTNKGIVVITVMETDVNFCLPTFVPEDLSIWFIGGMDYDTHPLSISIGNDFDIAAPGSIFEQFLYIRLVIFYVSPALCFASNDVFHDL